MTIAAGWIVLAAAAAGPVAPTASAVTTDAGARGVRQALSPNARAAFDVLRAASTFESAHIGYGGTLSENARAVRTLIRESEAPRAFQVLYDSRSPVPVLYALTAFWYLRSDEFLTLAKQARDRFGSVRIATVNGCIRNEETVAEVLERPPQRPAARRLAPGTGSQALTCAERKGGTFVYDFVSGTFPITIVEEQPERSDRKTCAHPPPLPDHLKPRR